ncbi:MAG: IclR family transcriptional regulator [Lautropia sp.]
MSNEAQTRPAIYEDTLADKQFATTLARGLEILRAFTPQEPMLGNKELSQRTGLPKATISRFTYTLTRLGYLRTMPAHNKYQLGSAVLSLSYPLLASMPLRQIARRAMNELADEVGGSVAMCIRDRLNIVFVETSRSHATFAPQYTDIGFTHPIVATSVGSAYLAACTAGVRETILNEIRVKTPELWTRYRGALERNLKKFGKLGFCISTSYYRPDVLGVGVPLRHMLDGDIVVFSCLVHAQKYSPKEVEAVIGPRLVALVRNLEFSPGRPY